MAAVDRVGVEDFTKIAGFNALPAAIQGDILYWERLFFRESILPKEQGTTLDYWIHAASITTPDLVEINYHCNDYDLRVIEGQAFCVVYVNSGSVTWLEELDRLNCAGINQIADQLFNLLGEDGRLLYQCPDSMRGEVYFSSNDNADPYTLDDWRERLDGGIRQDNLFYSFYKKHRQLGTYPVGKDWFDDDFRRHLGFQPAR